MRGWAIAVGLSVAMHLSVVVVVFWSEEPVAVAAADKKAESFVSFTPVSLSPSGERVGERAYRAVRKKAQGAQPVAVEARSGLVESPHPAPLALGGEGDRNSAVAVPGPGPELIALVHARLAAIADRCYPAAARRFQQRGTVQLSFCTDGYGSAASTTITQSSGAELLDAAAQGCVVEQASPFPPEAASRCFSVPVRFGSHSQ